MGGRQKLASHLLCSVFLAFLAGCSEKQTVPHISSERLLEEMYASIRSNDAEHFKSLWSVQAPDFRSTGYESPLVYAARLGSTDILIFLLGNLSHTEMELESALRASVTQSKVDTVATLVQRVSHARLAELDDQLLYDAVEAGMTQVGKYFLDMGATLCYEDGDGNTLLHAAATSGETDFVNLLSRAGVDPSSRNLEGLTALDIAQKLWGNQSRIAEELERFKAEPGECR